MALTRLLGADVCLGIFLGAASTPWWMGVETKRTTMVRARMKRGEEERDLLEVTVSVECEAALAEDPILMTEEKGMMIALWNEVLMNE